MKWRRKKTPHRYCFCCEQFVILSAYRLGEAKCQRCYDTWVDEKRFDVEEYERENLPLV